MLRKLALAFTTVLAAFALAACVPPLPEDMPTSTSTPSPTIEVSSPAANSTELSVQEHVATEALVQAGFEPNELRTGNGVRVPDNLDEIAPTGPQAVCSKPILTPEDAATALALDTPGARLIINKLREMTSATEAEVKDADNWATVQMLVTTYWPGNTYVDENGELKLSRTGRVDAAGTIGVVFVPPRQVAEGTVTSIGMLRGTCCNPEIWLPMPAPGAIPTPKDEVEITPPPPPEQPTPTPTPTTTPPTKEPCPPPASYKEWGIPDNQKHLYGWDNEACAPYKLPVEQGDQQNEGSPPQPGDENSVDTGDGPGTSTEPVPNPVHTPPSGDDPAPAPSDTPGGYRPPNVEDEAPDGTSSNDGDTDVGDHGGTSDPDDAGTGGDNGIGDDGGSNGGGTIADPDAP